MANEYRVYGINAEAVVIPHSDARVYGLSAEVVVTLKQLVAPRFVSRARVVFKPTRSENRDPVYLAGNRFAYPADFGNFFFPLRANGRGVFGASYFEKLSATSNAESNPYKPAVLARDNPNEYLGEQAAIIREQHNLSQAGDTTFDYTMIFEASAEQKFTLGAAGRFYHKDWGLVQARYVKFVGMLDVINCGAPVGRLKTSESVDWVVTNDISKSGADLVMGVAFFSTQPADGSYGWIVTHGVNPITMRAGSNVVPNQNDAYSWSATGRIGLGVRGRVLGRRWGPSFTAACPPGTIFFALESLSPADLVFAIQEATADLSAEVSALDGRLTVAENRISSNTTSIASLTTQATDLARQLSLEITTRSRQFSTLESLLASGATADTIAGALNTVRAEFAAADVSLQNQITAQQSRIASLESANSLTNYSSLVGRVDSLTQSLNFLTANVLPSQAADTDQVLVAYIDPALVAAADPGEPIPPEWIPTDYKIVALKDFDNTTPATDGQAIVWDAADGVWKPGDVAAGGGGGGGGALATHAVASIAPGGGASLSKSYNVASITRTAAGRYRVNFTNPMPDADYLVVGSGKYGSYPDGNRIDVGIDRQGSKTTTYCDIVMGEHGNLVLNDPDSGSVTVLFLSYDATIGIGTGSGGGGGGGGAVSEFANNAPDASTFTLNGMSAIVSKTGTPVGIELSVEAASGNRGVAMYKAAPAAPFCVTARLVAMNTGGELIYGLCVMNSVGNMDNVYAYTDGNIYHQRWWDPSNYAGNIASYGGFFNFQRHPMYLAFGVDGSGTIKSYVSNNGVKFFEFATDSLGGFIGTADFVGVHLATQNSGGNKASMLVPYFRIETGVTVPSSVF